MKGLFFILSVFLFFTGTAQPANLDLLGQIDPTVFDVSGIVRTSDARIFVIGDSGNSPTVYELDETGDVIHQIEILQAVNVDWEELQLDNQGRLFIGDIGNNLGYRTDLKIYRIDDFESKMDQDTIADFETIHYTYSDQEEKPIPDNDTSFDCEAMLVMDNEIHIYSKDHGVSGVAKHYSMPTYAGAHVASLLDSIPRENWITGAAHDHINNMIYFVSDSTITSFDPETKQQGVEITIDTFQLEGICFFAENQFLLTEDIETEPESRLYSLVFEAQGQMTSSIFPNPNDDRMLFARSNAQIESIEVLDYLGKTILSHSWSKNIGNVALNLDILSSGTYLVKVKTRLDVQVHKLILR